MIFSESQAGREVLMMIYLSEYKLNKDVEILSECYQISRLQISLLVNIDNFLIARRRLGEDHRGVGGRGRVWGCSSSLHPAGGEDAGQDDGDEEGEVEDGQHWTGVLRPRTNISLHKHSPYRDLSLVVEDLLGRYDYHGGHDVSELQRWTLSESFSVNSSQFPGQLGYSLVKKKWK